MEGPFAQTDLRVLVVEDEFYIADDLARALAQAGTEVAGPVARVGDALALLAEPEPIDAAILDVNLRGESVFTAAEKLRAAGVPFVFATGCDGALIPAEFEEVPRWEKPFDVGALVSEIRRLGRSTRRGRD